MPRIRRWFHVSHDINSDPEVWELTDKFGERAFRVWMEILSIADRYDGLVPGETKYLSSTLAAKCKSRSRTVEGIIKYATDKEWIVYDPVRRVCKHLKYRPTRGDKQIPEGKQTASPPLLHTPTLPTPKALKRTMSAPADRSFLNGFDALWKSYPEPRGSKDDALKAYKEKKPPPEALEALKAQIAYKAECDTRDQFWPQLPHLVRWIKKRRWTDEIPRSQQHDDPLDREIKRIRRDIHGDKETD
jgi:hypothetical protein